MIGKIQRSQKLVEAGAADGAPGCAMLAWLPLAGGAIIGPRGVLKKKGLSQPSAMLTIAFNGADILCPRWVRPFGGGPGQRVKYRHSKQSHVSYSYKQRERNERRMVDKSDAACLGAAGPEDDM